MGSIKMNPVMRWVEGMKNLTVAQQLHGKIAGLYGNIIGMSTGLFTMAWYVVAHGENKWWWTIAVLFFAVWLSIIDLIGTRQQWKAASEIELKMKQLKNKEEDDGANKNITQA